MIISFYGKWDAPVLCGNYYNGDLLYCNKLIDFIIFYHKKYNAGHLI